ncbi:hypothetical protein [Gibbsiella quercinecans]|nr:hypothetical protein [Gibbsiella quercinecans]
MAGIEEKYGQYASNDSNAINQKAPLNNKPLTDGIKRSLALY